MVKWEQMKKNRAEHSVVWKKQSRGNVEMRRKRDCAVGPRNRKIIFFDLCINENLRGVRKPICVLLTCFLGKWRNHSEQRFPLEPSGCSTRFHAANKPRSCGLKRRKHQRRSHQKLHFTDPRLEFRLRWSMWSLRKSRESRQRINLVLCMCVWVWVRAMAWGKEQNGCCNMRSTVCCIQCTNTPHLSAYMQMSRHTWHTKVIFLSEFILSAKLKLLSYQSLHFKSFFF